MLYRTIRSACYNRWRKAVLYFMLFLGFFEEPTGRRVATSTFATETVKSMLLIELVLLALCSIQLGIELYVSNLKTIIAAIRAGRSPQDPIFGWRYALNCVCVLSLLVDASLSYHYQMNKHDHNHERGRIMRVCRVLLVIESDVELSRQCRFMGRALFRVLEFWGIALIVMVIYAVMGVLFFGKTDPWPTDCNGKVPDSMSFKTMSKALYTLLVLQTTANYPDVMLRQYEHYGCETKIDGEGKDSCHAYWYVTFYFGSSWCLAKPSWSSWFTC